MRAYLGELDLATTTLAERNRELASTCLPPHTAFCRRIALAALESDVLATQGAGLELYLGLAGRVHGPLALRLARSGARVAERLDAPRFGANLLASTIEGLRRDELALQLAEAARLYELAGDRARAEVIREYAVSRGQRLPGAPAGREPDVELPMDAAGSASSDEELARAALALARARLQAEVAPTAAEEEAP